MGALKPISWRDLVRRLREHGFEGPYSGGKHLFMIRGTRRLTIPNHIANKSAPLYWKAYPDRPILVSPSGECGPGSCPTLLCPGRVSWLEAQLE